MIKSKIKKGSDKFTTFDRMCDAIGITLRDLIVKDLLTDSDTATYYNKRKAELFPLFNIYIDRYENDPSVKFNLSIDGKPASEECSKYEMFTISGNSNESGNEPHQLYGTIVSSTPDTIVKFSMPIDPDLHTFSQHKDGFSYANYVIYGIKDDKSKIMLCKGKIHMTDVLFDLTENILDGQ